MPIPFVARRRVLRGKERAGVPPMVPLVRGMQYLLRKNLGPNASNGTPAILSQIELHPQEPEPRDLPFGVPWFLTYPWRQGHCALLPQVPMRPGLTRAGFSGCRPQVGFAIAWQKC